jgi:SAM-dependent methyltransferase
MTASLPGEARELPPRPSWLPADAEIACFYAPTVRYAHYRIRVTEYIARLLPPDGPCSILDVGAGDGYLGVFLETNRPKTSVVGVEVEPRLLSHPRASVALYDGLSLPFSDRAFDFVLLTNVLHHAQRMVDLFRESCRVGRRAVLIKDHVSRGHFDRWRLALLDILGNRRFGASVAGDYLDPERWNLVLEQARCGRVSRYDGLIFRQGWLATVFGNHLEIVFAVNLAGVSGRTS